MTIEERAKEYADRLKSAEIGDFGIVTVYGYKDVYNANITAYKRGATEQKAIDKEAALKGFTTDELRAELKRRNAEGRAERESVLRCRMCRHWGAIDYWGNPSHYLERDTSRTCKFFKTKNGKSYRCHNASQLACEHFERKKE